jgi:hypothetical protein
MEHYFTNQKNQIIARIRECIKVFMQKKNIRSYRQFCLKYGLKPSTLAEYLKGRLRPEFIGKLAFITGCSESWLLVGQGEMFGENILTKEQDGRKDDSIRVPFGWEVSVFTPEKLHGQVAYLNFPASYPFDMIARGRKMLALYLDANAKLIGCKIQRGSFIVIDQNETEVKPGNSYLLMGKTDRKISIKRFKDKLDHSDSFIMGRVFADARFY